MTEPRRPRPSSGRGRRDPSPPPFQTLVAIVMTLIVFSLVVYMSLLPVSSTSITTTTTITAESDAAGGGALHLRNLNPMKDVHSIEAVLQEETEKAERGLRTLAQRKKEQFQQALGQLLRTTTTKITTTTSSRYMPHRLKTLREAHQIVGEKLVEIQSGTETVPELLHPLENGGGRNSDSGGGGREEGRVRADKPPMELTEIKDYLEQWLHSLHETLGRAKHATFEGIWQAYHDLTVQTLYVWDRDYLSRMPPRRTDDSIFLSVASYRDENCIHTLNGAYQKSKDPLKLFVGLVQQNCHQDCKSGIMEGGHVEDVEPDMDCQKAFCEGPMKAYCGNVRVLNIDEPESLGPYAARYFASKLWYGEQWFMQTDAHMTFAQDWDQRYVPGL